MKKLLLATAITITASSAFADTMALDNMDHGKMDHSKMDHGKMDHSKMAMSMNMEGMSEVGMPAKGAKPDKVVHVLLSDDMTIKFKKEVNIEPNDVVQFVIMNVGKMEHEFSIGSKSEQLAHREMMKSMTQGHQHDSGSNVTVQPNKAKQLLWHFHGDNTVEFACNIPGHTESGMVKTVTLK